jgi:radical SAM protein with 4Fe4S-binding SPASM domain
MPVPPIEAIPLARLLDETRAVERRVPLEGTLETTYRCNLACAHCYVNQPANDANERAREVPLARLLRLVDEIAAAGTLDLLLTGGEVLLRPDFPELYRHAVGAGLRVTVFTNGTLVTERIAELFAEHVPACVEVSLYGATRATYERVTGIAGSYDRCLAGIRRLAARRVPLRLKTMALAWNAHELEAMRAFAAGLGLEFRHDSLLNARVDCGRSRNGELQLDARHAVALDLADAGTRAKLERAGRELEALLAAQARGAAERRPLETLYSCGAGQMAYTVDPYGRLQACQLTRRTSYDLTAGSFAEGWDVFLPRLRERRWQTDAACRTCTITAFCGSCPGAAELETGDPEGQVARFCEIAHQRAEAVLGARAGHRRDARCCLGRAQRSAQAAGQAGDAGGCGGCDHAAEPALVRIGRRSGARA